jgi:hypothetical protein
MCIYYDSISPSDKGYCPYQQRRQSEIKNARSSSYNKLPSQIYYKSINGAISFYAAYGKEYCGRFSTPWCRNHCYMKTQPFKESVNKKIQKVNLQDYDNDVIDKLVDCIKDEKYVTFFASGCIERIKNTYEFIQRLTNRLRIKKEELKIRFFIRTPYIIENTIPNATIILSVYKGDGDDILNKGIENHSINGIAIINHPNNRKLIDQFETQAFEKYMKLHKIDKIIYCSECNGKMLCFNQTKRFVLIQEYKEKDHRFH